MLRVVFVKKAKKAMILGCKFLIFSSQFEHIKNFLVLRPCARLLILVFVALIRVVVIA